MTWWSRKKQDLAEAGIEISVEEKMPITSGIAEFVREILYDSEPLGIAGVYSLFTVPCGFRSPGTNQIKTIRDTNMWMCQMLPSPMRFLITGIRCIFLEQWGEIVPITDAIYWESVLTLIVAMKVYWTSPAALVVDPMILTTPDQWIGLSDERKLALYRRFSRQQTQDFIPPDQIVEPSVVLGSPELKGILIGPQQPFEVQIEHDGKWPERRILCVLQGTAARPVL